ncbi:MAG: MATE family multidrug resistance protein, partial [Myxococcota bacterium]
EGLGREYFIARIPGAPAALMGYGIMGWLIGVGRTRALLAYQVVANGTNVVLDITFVAGFDLGPAGVGAGTAIAEWVALFFGLWLLRREFGELRRPRALLEPSKIRAMLAANRDVMIRTLALLFSFAWFINSGASVGTAALAGNQVLLQFVSVAAFVLDAFAFVTEREVGEAIGAERPEQLRLAIRRTSTLAIVSGSVFSVVFFLAGSPIIEFFVADPEARAAALNYLPYCAIVPLLGVPAWQLDGIFLGATAGKALRNAGVMSAVVYIALDISLSAQFGNTGVWTAFLAMYGLRAIALGSFLPGLLRSAQPAAR